VPPPRALRAFLETTLRILPGEGRRVALLFLHLFLAAGVFFLGRTVRDTLFLSHYPIAALPWMFVVYGAVSAAIAVVYGPLADRLPRQRLIVLSCAVGAATYLGAWILVRAGVRWVYPAFYVWTEVVSTLFIVQFWTLAGDLLDARAARRLFGTIGSARLLASVLVGLAVGAVVRVVGTAQLIFVLAALMGAIAWVATALARESHAPRGARAGAQPRHRGPPPRLLEDPYLRALAAVLLLAFTALNVGDFQFKAVARAAYHGDELAGFFARFYAVSGAIAFLFQLVATPWILGRAGVGWGMRVMPGAFGGAALALAAWPRVGVAALMKFTDNGFQFTIQESTFQALYVPFRADAKARTRALLEAVVKPLGYGLAGLVVLLLATRFQGAPQRFALVTIPLVAGWLALVPLVHRLYLRRLEATLTARGGFPLDEGFTLDHAGRRALLSALHQRESHRVLVALEQLATERGEDVTGAVEMLVSHPDPVVREAALHHLARSGLGRPDAARPALADADPDVRAAAATAMAALAHDDAVDDLAPLLADPEAKVRADALGGVLRYGGIEGGIVGGAELGRLLNSAVREDQVGAARAMRDIGPGAYRPLRRLLASDDATVRRAALRAAVGDPDPRLVPQLIALMADAPSRHRAGQALVAIGEAAAPALGAALDDPAVLRAVKLEVPRLLRRMPQQATYDLLREHLHDPDSRLRLRLYAALSMLRRELHRAPEPVEAILALVHEEIVDAARVRGGWAAARPRFGSPLLEELFEVRAERLLIRVLRVLELRYDADALALVREHLAEPGRHANALEVLDALLDTPLRPVVMPLADEGVQPPVAGGGPDPVAFMTGAARHPNPYVALLALDALARVREPAGAEAGAALLSHQDPLVREGAILALAACDGSTAADRIRPLVNDPDALVAHVAAHGMAHLEGREAPEGPMYSTVEKILYLKGAPVFEHVAGEDLAPLARVAEAEVYAPGQALVREGETGDALYIIVRGQVKVEHAGNLVGTLSAGDTVGEMSVLDSEPRRATVTATEETEVLRIGSEAFYEILHEQVEIAEGVIRMLSNRLREADTQIKEMRKSMAVAAVPEPGASA
jgi:ATP/ADP translocase/HEAT repeat protein